MSVEAQGREERDVEGIRRFRIKNPNRLSLSLAVVEKGGHEPVLDAVLALDPGGLGPGREVLGGDWVDV